MIRGRFKNIIYILFFMFVIFDMKSYATEKREVKEDLNFKYNDKNCKSEENKLFDMYENAIFFKEREFAVKALKSFKRLKKELIEDEKSYLVNYGYMLNFNDRKKILKKILEKEEDLDAKKIRDIFLENIVEDHGRIAFKNAKEFKDLGDAIKECSHCDEEKYKEIKEETKNFYEYYMYVKNLIEIINIKYFFI